MDLSLPGISLFKKAKTEVENISSVEAFQLWNILRIRYMSVETNKFYLNFVHDRDFELLIEEQLGDYEQQINEVEKLIQKYNVKPPDRPPKEIEFSVKIDEVTDKFIYRKLHEDLVAELYTISRTPIDSIFNDNLREKFITYTLSHIENFEALYKFSKLKGWTQIAPTYKSGKEVAKEQITTSESSQLLEHINFRYDQLQLTQYFVSVAHDTEFKQILKQGQDLLKEQVKLLEEKATEFGVPLSERPPVSFESRIDPEGMEDQFMYRMILKGMQDSIHMHMRGILETLRNDNLRQLFDKFMRQELNSYDNYVKYGKAKGWTPIKTIYGNC